MLYDMVNSLDRYIDNIITEEVRMVISENAMDNIAKYLKDFQNKKKGKKKRKYKKKTAKGGSMYYDYDDYQRKNKKISKADIDSIIDTVDMEKTNLAAIARIIFPKHTEEGAQSQLRKILNRERPMSKRVASMLEKLISSGQIAVKS